MSRERERIRWRGTHGVGDFMHALNVCHQYAFEQDKEIDLQMHWEHDKDFLYHPDDPETIVQRLEFIKGKYYLNRRVKLSHVFNSTLFHYDDENQRHKVRFLFDSEHYHPIVNETPPNQWLFDPREYTDTPEKRIVVWTPYYNREQPRRWKRWFGPDDWEKFIRDLEKWEGWDVIELTYRTPIRDAYNQIRRARYVASYDGMWHYIARNFCKPHLIPSNEGVTTYNTPNAVKVATTEGMANFFKDDENLGERIAELRQRAEAAKSKINRDFGVHLRKG